MRGNPAVPGGPLASKPARSNDLRVFDRAGFFCLRRRDGRRRQGRSHMDKSNSTMAQQLGQAASAFEQQRTGHVPKSVSVVLNKDTLVITLHGALSPAEKSLAKSPAGAAEMQEFHRQLFANSSDSLRQEIKRITGVEVREATAEIETI